MNPELLHTCCVCPCWTIDACICLLFSPPKNWVPLDRWQLERDIKSLKHSPFQRLYLARNLKSDFLWWGLFHFVCKSFPMQLVVIVHRGFGFEGFTREQGFEKIPKIDPFFDEIAISVSFGPIFVFSETLLSRKAFEVRPCMKYQLHWEALPKRTN